MSAATPTQLPDEIQAHIRSGGAVRTDPADPYAGRCGKRVERRGGDTFCRRAAGWGTDHLSVGTCRNHPLEAPGLAPWVGSVPPSEWQRITGHNIPGPEGSFQTTHGATALASIEEMFAERFDGEDRQLYDAVPVGDPVRILDVVIRVNTVALGRVQKHIGDVKRLAAIDGRHASFDSLAGPESLLTKISGSIARLNEARAKYVEIAKRDESREGLADLLRNLSADDFARVAADPHLLDSYQPAAL